MEFKYSLFGNFNLDEKKANQFSECFGKDLKRTIENDFLQPFVVQQSFQIANVFVLQGEDFSIRMSNTRIDFIFKNSDKIDHFEELFNKALLLFPKMFSRLAINVNYATKDPDESFLKKVSSKTEPNLPGFRTAEFFLRKNLKNEILGHDVNNIITIQNGAVKAENEFSATNGLVFSVDLNTAIDQNNPFADRIRKEDVVELFKTLMAVCENDFDVIDKFIEK